MSIKPLSSAFACPVRGRRRVRAAACEARARGRDRDAAPRARCRTSGRRQRARGRRRAGSGGRSPRGTPAAAAFAFLGRRKLAAALLPAARHRRTRAIPGRAESVGRLPRRRDRLQRHRHDRLDLRRRAGRGAARSPGHAIRRERARRPHQGQDARSRAGARAGDRGCRSAAMASGPRAPPPAAHCRPATHSRAPGAPCSSARSATGSARTGSSGATTRTAATRRRRGSSSGSSRSTAGARTSRCCTPTSTTATTRSRSTTASRRCRTGPGSDSQRSDGASLDLARRRSWGTANCGRSPPGRNRTSSRVSTATGATSATGARPGPTTFSPTRGATRRTLSEDLRLSSAAEGAVSWIAGLWLQRLEETNRISDDGLYLADAFVRELESEYRATSAALYGQARLCGHAGDDGHRGPAGSRSATPATTTATASPSTRATGCGAASFP